MNTRDRIISLLSQSKSPMGAKEIAAALKRTNANIRKILSNLCKEEKVARVGFGRYLLSVNVSKKGVNVADKKVSIYTSGARRKEDPFEEEKWIRI